MRYKWKYITYGREKYAPKMYVVTLLKRKSLYEISVYVCDINGKAIGDPVVYQSFKSLFKALYFFYKQYNEFNRYINYRD